MNKTDFAQPDAFALLPKHAVYRKLKSIQPAQGMSHHL
jgi:hypothetical protein